MKEKEILNHLKSSIESAPIDLLDNIKNQNVVKMHQHDEITMQESTKDNIISFQSIISLASIAAVFIFILVTFSQFIIPYTEIYLDINPGIQMVTNRKNQVIKLKAVNEEAKVIIDQINYRHKDVEVVTDEILNSLIENNYIEKEDEVILLSVFNKDKEKSKSQASYLDEVIHQKLDNMNKKPILLIQALDKSNTIQEFANKYGISVGKMTFIRNLIILNPNLKTEDLVQLSLTELIMLSRDTGINIQQIIESSDIERAYEKLEDIMDGPMIDDDDKDVDDDYEDHDDDDDVFDDDDDDRDRDDDDHDYNNDKDKTDHDKEDDDDDDDDDKYDDRYDDDAHDQDDDDDDDHDDDDDNDNNEDDDHDDDD